MDNQLSESLQKRLAYLAIADYDFVAGRLLIYTGLQIQSLSKYAEAFEKLLKLGLILGEKIKNNSALDTKSLKSKAHNLSELYKSFVELYSPYILYNEDIYGYLEIFQDSYEHMRYPEGWKTKKFEINIQFVDQVYFYFRQGIVSNFPQEDQEKAKVFGGFNNIGSITDYSKTLGIKTPKEVLMLNNPDLMIYASLTNFDKLP